MSLFDERVKRTKDAIALQPVDKIPYSYSGCAYVARRQGIPMSEFIRDFPRATDATIAFCKAHPGIDSIHSPIMEPALLSTLWLSRVKLPGVDLPEDDLWQVDEREVLTRDDYVDIIENGYAPWLDKLMRERLGDPYTAMLPFLQNIGTTTQRMNAEAQLPVMNGANAGTPFEGFCGGRTLVEFFIDVMEEPELVKKACDAAHAYTAANFAATLEAAKPFAAWVGGWRAAPELMSHEIWIEYVWPYMKELIEIAIAKDVIPILHIDSNWDREIGMFRELPARTLLIMLDGTTNIRRAREILDDHSCLMGDVPASMLAFGSEDDVYNYTKKLIDDVGPKTGLIVSSGCDNPLNAKDANVDAMIQATLDYNV